jgi:hypothetical protein
MERCLETLGDDLETLRKMEALAGEALARVSLIAREACRSAPDGEWIQRTWIDVPAIDLEIETLGRSHPPLMPPETLFGFGKEALEGKVLAPMVKSVLGIYGERKAHFSALAEVIGRLVETRVNARRDSCHT